MRIDWKCFGSTLHMFGHQIQQNIVEKFRLLIQIFAFQHFRSSEFTNPWFGGYRDGLAF